MPAHPKGVPILVGPTILVLDLQAHRFQCLEFLPSSLPSPGSSPPLRTTSFLSAHSPAASAFRFTPWDNLQIRQAAITHIECLLQPPLCSRLYVPRHGWPVWFIHLHLSQCDAASINVYFHRFRAEDLVPSNTWCECSRKSLSIPQSAPPKSDEKIPEGRGAPLLLLLVRGSSGVTPAASSFCQILQPEHPKAAVWSLMGAHFPFLFFAKSVFALLYSTWIYKSSWWSHIKYLLGISIRTELHWEFNWGRTDIFIKYQHWDRLCSSGFCYKVLKHFLWVNSWYSMALSHL